MTVRLWCNRFAELRYDRLLDEPRPAGHGWSANAQVDTLITATLETAPPDATHWSIRSMAKHLGMSQSMVSRVWRAFGLAPHEQDSWKPQIRCSWQRSATWSDCSEPAVR
jgi:hypothetical protein